MESRRFRSFLIMLTVLYIHFFPPCGNSLWTNLWIMWKSVRFQQLFLIFTTGAALWIICIAGCIEPVQTGYAYVTSMIMSPVPEADSGEIVVFSLANSLMKSDGAE